MSSAPKNKGGRPKGSGLKLTPEVEALFIGYMRLGSYVKDACHACGINPDTYYDWVKKGERGEEGYISFSDAVKKASAEGILGALAKVRAGKVGWQAQAWFLERRDSASWGRHEKVEHTIDLHEAVKVVIEKLKAQGVEGADELTVDDVLGGEK
jgi:hypothetical protein